MIIQQDLTGKPKQFFFSDGLEPKRPKGIKDPHEDITLHLDQFGGLRDDR